MRLTDYAETFKTAVLSRTDDGVLTVRLHYREGQLTWTALVHREFPALLEAVESDEANRVVVLTGTGDAFIRTPDNYRAVYRSGTVTPADWERGIGEATRMLYRMADRRVPVVAALNGPVTGHSELVLLCDLVICTQDTYFEDGAHLVGGLVPGDGMQVLWPRVLGPVRARHFLLAAQRISAAEALALGVVGEVVPRGRAGSRSGRPGPVGPVAYPADALPPGAAGPARRTAPRLGHRGLRLALPVAPAQTVRRVNECNRQGGPGGRRTSR